MTAYLVLDDGFVPTPEELSVLFEMPSVIYAESDAEADAKMIVQREEIRRVAKERQEQERLPRVISTKEIAGVK